MKNSSTTMLSKQLAELDPILATVINQVQLPELSSKPNHYRSLVEAIVAQQLSDKASSTIISRFKKLFPRTLFPKPQTVLAVPVEVLRSVGISGSKAKYIRDLSQKIIAKELDLKKVALLPDEAVIIELTKVKGIGRWTAEMFLIFSLGRPDVFSFGDLGLKNALQKLYGLPKQPSPKQVKQLTEKWKPYRSLACRYLWAALSLKS